MVNEAGVWDHAWPGWAGFACRARADAGASQQTDHEHDAQNTFLSQRPTIF